MRINIFHNSYYIEISVATDEKKNSSAKNPNRYLQINPKNSNISVLFMEILTKINDKYLP